jgi:hypothetical protein
MDRELRARLDLLDERERFLRTAARDEQRCELEARRVDARRLPLAFRDSNRLVQASLRRLRVTLRDCDQRSAS